MRSGSPAGAQIEYERRSSPRLTVTDWPGRNAKISRSSAGTSKVIAAESSVSRSTRATVSSWKLVIAA